MQSQQTHTTYKWVLALALIIFTLKGFTQTKTPDTLVIKTAAGQIILVSDSLQKFNKVSSEMLIKRSLYQVRDSLSETKEERVRRIKKERYTYILRNKFPIRILPNVGIGTIRDKISPLLGLSLDFGPQRQDYYLKSGGYYTFLNLAANMSFSFEKEDGEEYTTHKNLFLEFSMGNRINNFVKDYGMFSEASFGFGYLANKSGNYFQRNTFKVFANVGLYKSFVKIKPELYFTDNFNKVFPGITLKFF